MATGVAAALTALSGRDYLSSADCSADETHGLIDLAHQLKCGDRRIELGNRVLGLIFSKASTRTRVSFQVAMARLGGQTVDLHPGVTQLGRGEPLQDTARVLSRYCDVLAVRTFAQQEIVDYAHWATVPVINALTDLEHPCQALKDFSPCGKPATWPVRRSPTSEMAATLPFPDALRCGARRNVRIGCPEGFEPLPGVLEQARSLAQQGAQIDVMADPSEAVRGAQAVYTDVWASMGQEQEQQEREQAFEGFTVDRALMDQAAKGAIVLHCLPAHRGEEITAEVMESAASRIFDQAENRLHVQQALLAAVMGGL